MTRLAADENFDARIVTGLRHRAPTLEIVSIRDVGLEAAPDQVVLASAAVQGCVLLTHDRATLVGFAYDRVERGESMSGVVAVSSRCPIGRAVDDPLLLVTGLTDDEWDAHVYFVPL